MRVRQTATLSLLFSVALVTALFGAAQLSAHASSQADSAGGAQVAADAVARGEAVYAARCASCHGTTLGGGGHVPPLKGRSFVAAWSGLTMRALYSRTISTMPWNDPGSLSEENTVDLVAYIARQNGLTFPNGVTRADQLNSLPIAE